MVKFRIIQVVLAFLKHFLKVTGNALNIFSGVIVILAYKSTTAFRFTSCLSSVINIGIKD